MYLINEGDTEMFYTDAWLDLLNSIREEGRAAAQKGQAEYENPYDFLVEMAQAYAWMEGYKAEKKKGAA